MAVGQHFSSRIQKWAARTDQAASPAAESGRAHSTPPHPGTSVWFAEDEQLTQVETIGNQDNDIVMPDIAASQVTDVTLTSSASHDATTMSGLR